MHHSGDIQWFGAYPIGVESIDLGPDQQDKCEIVEEQQKNDRETCIAGIATQEMADIEWEERNINLEGHSSYQRAAPAFAPTDFLVGDNHINGLEKDQRGNQAT